MKNKFKKQQNTISMEQYGDTIKSYQDQLVVLNAQINQRDKLIGLMQADHQRTVGIADDIKSQIRAVAAFVEAFQTSWHGFKRTALDEKRVDQEFNQRTFQSATEIRNLIGGIYHGNDQSSGQIVGPEKAIN